MISKEVKNILMKDKNMEKSINSLSKSYEQHRARSNPYANAFNEEDVKDFCHHFGPAIGLCLEIAKKDVNFY